MLIGVERVSIGVRRSAASRLQSVAVAAIGIRMKLVIVMLSPVSSQSSLPRPFWRDWNEERPAV